MIQKYFFRFILPLLSIALLTNCRGTKKLSEGQVLYTGAELELESPVDIPNKAEVKNELSGLIRPDPNNSIFGMRPQLWIYQATKDTTNNKGLDHWINTKLGEPPVLMQNVNPQRIRNLMLNRLVNSGYFLADVDYDIEQENKTADVKYLARLHEPYRINETFYPDSTSEVKALINEFKSGTLLKPGNIYELDLLTRERDRISNRLRDNGYFYFTPDYLIFEADSTVGDKKINLYLDVKEEAPPKALRKYIVDEVIINPNYSLTDTIVQNQDTVQLEDYKYIINRNQIFDPEAIINSVFIPVNETYSFERKNVTLNRLMGLGVFRFVNVRFEEIGGNKLQGLVQLSPLKMKSLRFELQAVSKSNDYVGPNLNATFSNRNFLNGAELFELKLNSGFETQFGNRQKGLNSFEFGVETNLYIPRFIAPFNLRFENSYFVPKTRISLDYRYLNRMQFFKLNSATGSFGYTWRETFAREHRLNPIYINYFQLSDTTGAFQERLNNSDYLERSFEEQFIIGGDYSFTYQTPNSKDRITSVYFNGKVDIAGNSLYLLKKLTGAEGFPYDIFGTSYAQFAKFDLDFRYFYSLTPESKLAFRFLTGVGIAYGNSETLPFVKQYFIGGTNSIRAFEARSLGPGSYEPDSASLISFYDQSGDIKLEGNIEYRFPIYSIFKGAAFIDAGNIWLMDPNQEKPGGTFNFEDFFKEIAVGTGLGFRVDANFFVIRLDVAFPLRKPWFAPGDRWTFDEIDFGSSEWRRRNLIFNIAIGYPF